MKQNYVLIDLENVQPNNLSLLKAHDFRIMVFVGANQTKLSFELAQQLQSFGEKAEYIKISGNGPNALDFHIAYYIGKIAASNPNTYFHIISKDTGFDPLIKHLKAQKICIMREKDLSEIPLLKISNSTDIQQRISAVIENLTSRGLSRPRKTKTLANAINSWFMKTLNEKELEAIISDLKKRKIIVIENEKVTYKLAEEKAK